jgi:NAD(P)-dependent dehydrogenase (short-subunit alcohol dehydrogenase family)
LEAFSAIMAKDLAGTGITVNVLVPGGVTNTGMVPLEAGYNRAEMIQPAVMAPPLNWLTMTTIANLLMSLIAQLSCSLFIPISGR